MDTVFVYIYEHWPIGATIIITAIVIWNVAKFYFNRFKPVENTVKKIEEHSNCKGHGEDIDYTKKNIASIEKSLSYIMGTLKISPTEVPTPLTPLTETRSPRQVTESGHELLTLCGAKQLLTDKMEVFVSKLEEDSPKTALDVESQALKVLWALTDEDYFNKTKNYLL